jgi:hypothetical protein
MFNADKAIGDSRAVPANSVAGPVVMHTPMVLSVMKMAVVVYLLGDAPSAIQVFSRQRWCDCRTCSARKATCAEAR